MKGFRKIRFELSRLHPQAIKEGRQSGRSLSIALQALGQAIASPGAELQVVDHHGTPEADRYLLNSIVNLISRLELEGFIINRNRRTIRFVLPYADVEGSGGGS